MSDMSGGADLLKEAIEQMKRDAYASGWKAAVDAMLGALSAMDKPDGVDGLPNVALKPTAPRQAAADSGSLTVGTTPHYVYQAVQKKQGMTGAEVIAAVRADGHDVGEPQIRTALSRLEKRQLLANRHRKWFLK